MHSLALPPWIGFLLTALVCGGAFWKGGRDEHMAAGALVLGWVGTLVFRDPSWAGTQWVGFVIDCLLGVVLVTIALTSDRFWPLFAAGFQLLSIVTHVARMVDPQLHAWAYATAPVIWTQLLLLTLGIGVIGAWRRHDAD